MIEHSQQAALIIGYSVMTAGGVLLASFVLFCALVVAYKLLTRVANALTNRLINLHRLESVRRMYQEQEQGKPTKADECCCGECEQAWRLCPLHSGTPKQEQDDE